jgi:hypothetical protein
MAQHWKDVGNRRFREGHFKEAITAYSTGLGHCQDSEPALQAVLLCNRSVSFLNIGAFQEARRDAQDALNLEPANTKARFRLASALFHLRSYSHALELLRPAQRNTSSDIQTLLRTLITCVTESRHGKYDVVAMQEEAKVNPRLSHADYCSNLIELRKSEHGGVGGRGIFTKEVIRPGTLLVQSKAVACVFDDEVDRSTKFMSSLDPALRSSISRPIFLSLADKLYSTIAKNGCGRAILNLEGSRSTGLDIELTRDDVYETTEVVPEITPTEILDIILTNSFDISKITQTGEKVKGTALFHVPSYFNHSCMPNLIYATTGDIMLMKSSTLIPKDTEIFISYASVRRAESLQERTTTLFRRTPSITCNCGLCKFEFSNTPIADIAVQTAQEMRRRYQTSASRGSRKAITDLSLARSQLYELFECRMLPETKLVYPQTFPSDTPRQFALARLLNVILPMLYSSFREQDLYDEAAPYYAEAVSLVKGNLIFREGSILDAAIPVFYVWEYHRKTPYPEISGPIASVWLQELKEICSMVGGDKYFEKDFSKHVTYTEASVARMRNRN